MKMFATDPFSAPVQFRPGFRPRPELSHVVFDFDGTLSWLRHGWPQIMCGVFENYCPNLPGETDDQKRTVLLEEILALNGKPSIHQMRRCSEIANSRSGASPDPHHLLAQYQERLDEAIGLRSSQIQSGSLPREHFIVHGALPFLNLLRQRNFTMVILSGTVENRVREEAGLLGLSPFFGTHIYGSSGDGTAFSKADVLSRLLREENISGDHLVSFGDGPVEIEITKRFGGLAIALASDEELNGSGLLYPHKLTTLRQAGADALIPDFRDAALLLQIIIGERPVPSTHHETAP